MTEFIGRSTIRGKSLFRMLVISFLLSLLVIAAAVFITGRDCSEVRGRVVLTGPGTEGARRSFSPRACRSGEREGFIGVTVRDPAGGAVVLVDPRDGEPLVRVLPPGGGPEIILRQDRCSTFERAVRDTETQVQGITWRKGFLRLHCELQDGSAVEIDLHFSACG